jgi:hypothetical protein
VWENYHSTGDIEVYGVDGNDTADGCCVPTFTQSSGGFSATPKENDCCEQPSDDGSKCCN